MEGHVPVDVYFAQVRPDHWGEEDTWEEELRNALTDPVGAMTLHLLVREFVKGQPQREPVIVTPDGRVHDGHHRSLAVRIAGLPTIRVTTLRGPGRPARHH